MATSTTAIQARDFIRQIMAGERDFSSTRLTVDGAFDEQDGYPELLAYLQEQDLRASPINCEGADWHGVRARGLFWERSRMAGADLSGAGLHEAILRGADLVGANLQRADLSGATFVVAKLGEANFSQANMRAADMYECNATGANLEGADLTGAYLPRATFRDVNFAEAILTSVHLYKTDLRGARGLDTARDLAAGEFFKTIVTPAEHEAIRAAFRARPLFDLREE